ncbi:MAG: glycoside hydrolase family 95 protein [Anaerolineae bacterium]
MITTAKDVRDTAPLRLWYEQPAERWVEALPVGNGRLGAMVFSGVVHERLQLNEDTLWAGAPREWNNPEAKAALLKVREALFTGDFLRANQLSKEMQGPFTQPYLPLGDLLLHFDHEGEPTDYRRELDLDRAVVTTRYLVDGTTYTREVFCSQPDQVLAMRLEGDQPGALAFSARLSSPLRFSTSVEGSGMLVLRGKAPKHVDPQGHEGPDPIRYDSSGGEGMDFQIRLKVAAQGGRLRVAEDALHVEDADSVVILLAAATSFRGFQHSPGLDGVDPGIRCRADLDAAAGEHYGILLERHLADYQQLFGRVTLDLDMSASDAEAGRLPTDERLRRFRDGGDPGLAALFLQFGRYLLIASSRPGTQPANLQGIWNDQVQPPWNSNYTLNINAEMNYWPAEVCNLSECHEPLLQMIEELAVTGRVTAETNYGCHGWVAHHNSDLWRQSAPVGNYGDGNPVWAMWPMAAGWLCQHLWEHYAFTGDTEFLRKRAYPVMREAARFYLDWLVEDGHGHLVTAPATSPENEYTLPGGERAAVSVASTMDLAILHDLFAHCIAAAATLGLDPALRAELEIAMARLLPYQVGRYGQLQEWFRDWDDPEDHHRHVSHLFGVHPGHQFTPEDSPALLRAAQRSLELRGDGGTGWSMGWKINLWARFRDGDHAYRMLCNMLRPAEGDGTNYVRGGTYPNLFDAHPPFQIDGNFGATAGIAEMLLQSHRTTADGVRVLHLLPALPSAWPAGRVTGLRARGGFEVDISWANGCLVEVRIKAAVGGRCWVLCGEQEVVLETAAGQCYRLDGQLAAVEEH